MHLAAQIAPVLRKKYSRGKAISQKVPLASSVGDGAIAIRRWKDVGKAPLDIWCSLNSLSRGNQATELGWYPAFAILKNGNRVSCVAFVEKGSEAQDYFCHQTGFLRRKYQFDSSSMIDINSVASVSASPYATPIEIQEKMQKISTDMCKIILKDGRNYLLSSGTYEFSNVPRGYQAKDIVDVVEVSEKERESFPSSELRIWGELSGRLSLGIMYMFLDYSQQWEVMGCNDRAMLCFFRRPRLRRNSRESK